MVLSPQSLTPQNDIAALPAFADALIDGLLVIDLEGKIAAANRAAAETLGFSGKELISKTFSRLIPATVRPPFQRYWKKLVSGRGGPKFTQLRISKKGGEPIWAEITFSLLRDSGGKPQQVIALFRDISGYRVATEAELHESRRAYQELVEDINDVIFALDLDGVITYISPAIESLLGYAPKEIVGRHFNDFIYKEDLGYIINAFQEVLAGQLKPREYRMIDKHNNIHWIRSFSRPIIKKNEPAGLRGVLVDITEAKNSQLQLLQAQKMEALGTLAGGIAHDFNNILASIMGYAQLSLYDVKDGTTLAENLKMILSGTLRAKNLIRQIITFSRPKKEGMRPVLLTPIIKETLKFLKASLPATIQIRHYIKAEREVIEADPVQIQQVLMNLCTNAAQAMDEKGGILKVTAANVEFTETAVALPAGVRPGSYFKLSVSDTGCGIPDEQIDKIFDPYFTTKDKDHGTGLGLSVVLGILKKHEGGFSIESKVGRGTTIHVFFPVSDKEILESNQEGGAATGSERILVVDDEESIISIIKRTLERIGYEIVPFTHSKEALAKFYRETERFDLVITDMTMPNMTGDKLATEILRVRPDMPVILCTGYNEKISEKTARKLGIRGFIMKPFTQKQLTETIRRVMDRH